MNRETWLLQAIETLRTELFLPQGHTFPETIRVSMGFGFGRSGSSLSVLGQYWPVGMSVDGLPQIYISPAVDDSSRVLDILIHELCHAVVPGEGHGAPFKRVALSVGLTGKMRATVASESLKDRLNVLIERLGPIPHGRVIPPGRGGASSPGAPTNPDQPQGPEGAPKKQGTRMLPIGCSDCGFKARTTRQWLDKIGAPLCACNSKPMFVGGE